MSRSTGPGHRPPLRGGANRRTRMDDTLPGVQFPVIEDLTRITADDEFLDAIAAGGADLRRAFAGTGVIAAGGSYPTIAGPGGRRPVGLGPLLVTWRSELLAAPLPPLPALAARPMRAPADRSRRRSMRSLLSVGVAICTLLMASTAVGAHSAQPGQPLWGLSQVLWSEHAESVEARVYVETAFGKAKKAIEEGNPAKARELLDGLDVQLDKVLAVDGRAALHDNLTKLQQEAGVIVGTGGAPSSTGGSGSGSGPWLSPRAGLVPPVAIAASSRTRTASPLGSSGAKPAPSPSPSPLTAAGDPGVAQGGDTGPAGTPAESVTDLPVVPVVPPTTSSRGVPAHPGAPGPVSTAGSATPPPGPTAGSTPPVEPVTSQPVITTAPSVPGTTAGPTDLPPATPTDPSSTDASSTVEPPTSSADPSTSSTELTSGADPTSGSSTSDDPTTDTSTTSVIPTTLSNDPSTGPDGSTSDDPSTATTQPAPVNSTDEVTDTPGEHDPAGTAGESGP